jgi:hypothetical protein
MPPRTVFDRWDAPATVHGSAVDTHLIGPGLLVGGPVIARLMRALDRVFLDLAVAAGAVEHTVPALVTWETLDRAGYLRTFPQHVTACGVVGDDLEALDRFAGRPGRRVRGRRVAGARVRRPPSACTCSRGTPVRAAGAVPGHRVRYLRPVRGRPPAGRVRLWSLRCGRSCTGDATGAERFRAAMLEALARLANAVGLPCRLVTANDPFFTADRPQLTGYQRRFDVKYELCGRLAGDGLRPAVRRHRGGSSLAVGSLNIHQQHFGDAFGIGLPDGTPAYSACLGFGLERWAQWVHAPATTCPLARPAADAADRRIRTPSVRRSSKRNPVRRGGRQVHRHAAPAAGRERPLPLGERRHVHAQARASARSRA